MSRNIDANGNFLSPNSGTILEVYVQDGQSVLQGEMIIRLAKTGTAKGVRIELNETEREYYSQNADFEIIYSRESEDGTVTKKTVQGKRDSIVQDQESGIYSVTGIFTEDVPELEYGDRVRATLRSDGIVYEKIIPLSAIKENNGRKVLYILKQDEEGNYFVKMLQTAVLESGDYFAAVEIELEYGDRIITSTNKGLEDGEQVRIQQ